MRKILVTCMLLLALHSGAQPDTTPQKNYSYCVLHAFGPGHSSQYKGAFIVYDNLMVERRQLLEDNETAFLKLIMEAIKAIESRGYHLIQSDLSAGEFMKCQYVFRKEE